MGDSLSLLDDLLTLSDWLKNLVPVFQPKSKSIAPYTCTISRALGKIRVIATNSDWLIF